MVPKHWNMECMEKLIPDDYVECCAFCIFYNVPCLEIVFRSESVVDDRNRRLDSLKMLIVSASDNAFLDLLRHFFKCLEYIIDTREIIRMVKIDIGHDGIVRMI